MFGVSRSILFAGAAHPSLQSGFGVGVRRWPVGAATTEMLMLKRNAAICERRASAPKSDCPRLSCPSFALRSRIIQESDTRIDIVS